MYAEVFGHLFQTHSMLSRRHVHYPLLANIISSSRPSNKSICGTHGLFRTRPSRILQATLLQAGKNGTGLPNPQSELLSKLSLLGFGEVKVAQIHVAFEDDVKR